MIKKFQFSFDLKLREKVMCSLYWQIRHIHTNLEVLVKANQVKFYIVWVVLTPRMYSHGSLDVPGQILGGILRRHLLSLEYSQRLLLPVVTDNIVTVLLKVICKVCGGVAFIFINCLLVEYLLW